MKTIGSQKRELLADSGMSLYSDEGEHEQNSLLTAVGHENGVVLKDDKDGNLEFWIKNDNYAGYVIEIDGVGYEFVRTIS